MQQKTEGLEMSTYTRVPTMIISPGIVSKLVAPGLPEGMLFGTSAEAKTASLGETETPSMDNTGVKMREFFWGAFTGTANPCTSTVQVPGDRVPLTSTCSTLFL